MKRSGKAGTSRSGKAAGSVRSNKNRRSIIIWVCTAVCLAAVIALVIFLSAQGKKRREAEELAKLAQEITSAQPAATQPETEAAVASETTEETTKPKPDIPIDFEALWEINPDVYAWLTIEGSDIDYPIMKSSEDEPDYYLDYTIYHEYGLPGSIYIQSNYNRDLETDNVTLIYGHSMLNGTMFGTLKHFFDEDYRNARSQVYIYTPEHIYHYEIKFVVTFDDRHLLYEFDYCRNKETYASFISAIQTECYEPCWISEDFTGDTDQRMIVMSTCSAQEDRRILVGAVLVDEQ